jgi:Fe-S-cluster containining protein
MKTSIATITTNSHVPEPAGIRATPFVLDFGSGDSLRVDLPLPGGAATVRDLLPSIFALADAVHDHSSRTLAAVGKTIGCGPGCGRCCHQLVPISEHEAVHLAGVVRAMPAARRSRIVRRFTGAVVALDRAGLLTPLTGTFAAGATDRAALGRLARQYWRLDIPCPFLHDGSCLIHAHRPLACRQYLVTSAPDRCAALYAEDQDHEVVMHPVDTGGALAAFSGEGLERSRVVPLVFSLLVERSARARPLPVLPGPQMMGRFLCLLNDCFSRAG